jgi:hypothetical protein
MREFDLDNPPASVWCMFWALGLACAAWITALLT